MYRYSHLQQENVILHDIRTAIGTDWYYIKVRVANHFFPWIVQAKIDLYAIDTLCYTEDNKYAEGNKKGNLGHS
jgi:hypothetical protein